MYECLMEDFWWTSESTGMMMLAPENQGRKVSMHGQVVGVVVQYAMVCHRICEIIHVCHLAWRLASLVA